MEDYNEILDDEIIQEEDFTIETMKIRKKLRFRTFAAVIVVSLFFILRNFDPNIDFNNVNAPLFLFICVFVMILSTFIYFFDNGIKSREYRKEDTYKKYKILNEILEISSIVPYLALVMTIINMFFISLSPITGTSMMPNFTDDEAVIFSHLSSEYDRYDVVIVHQDSSTSPYLIKRIVGLPGETVKISENKIYIDDVFLVEEYIDSTVVTTYCTNATIGDYVDVGECSFIVPNDSYFVLGDNRDGNAVTPKAGFSVDSRYIGPVKAEEIYGKVVFKFRDYNLIK